MTMIDEHKKRVQALIKKIQVVAFILVAIIVVVVVFSSLPEEEKEEISESEKIIFTPPDKLLETTEGTSYLYSFCEPGSARSGATCGGLAGATTNPYGGNPPYSFSHQFGVGFIPPGLALELNGLLRGTPTLPGDYTFGVCVTDLYEEVCKTTSLTVNPKSEQLEEEISVEEQQLEEEVTPLVKIESATSELKECYKDDGKIYWCKCTVEMSGTATLPPSSSLRFTVEGFWTYATLDYPTCPNWEPEQSSCVRKVNQPATGEWSITFSQYFYSYEKQSRTYFATVPGGAGREEVWDSVTLISCWP